MSYKICKVCVNCYNENFTSCHDGSFACTECGTIYENVSELEDMDFQEDITINKTPRKEVRELVAKVRHRKRVVKIIEE